MEGTSVNKILSIAFILLLTFSVTGCGKKSVPPAETRPKELVITNVSSYFPVSAGLTWIYEGKGNEYAGFTRKAVRSENTLAQFSENNGGTQLGLVYQVTPDAVLLLYTKEEYYSDASLLTKQPNRSDILLKAPLKPGASWQDARYKRKVISITDTITVPGGTFTNVVQIRGTPLNQANTASQTEYYAPGVGLVAREYIAKDFQITSRLKSWSKNMNIFE